MFGIHADTSMKSEGGPGSAWLRRQWCLHVGYFAASALAYHIGLELLQGDRKLRMIGYQLHQFAHDEHTVAQLCEDSQMFICRSGAGSLSAVGTDGPLLTRLILESTLPMLPLYLPGHNRLPFPPSSFPRIPPLPSCDRMISPAPNADLFCNKTRCIQGQPSDVADVIVPHKSGTDTNLWPQWRELW